ncbi:SDR family oxidoreductase [Rhodoferax sp.]|uniref:SDR family oxidoreductase n=1 Tax=Rhodoferax sp. TaxID=50421 RepID=UPI0025FC8840|nr:SDR family oxidoreductase [Rhodoferax sp.]
MHWSLQNIPPQNDKRVVVTGVGGLGFEAALALAGAGAEVILAGRNPQKGTDAVRHLVRMLPQARVRFELLDLASLASVYSFADRLVAEAQPIAILVNNAGVMMPPQRQATVDGFELQFGTNYLGHFALTARLLPLLCQGQARVVNLSSIAHRGAAIQFDDLQWERRYKPWAAYGQSKLAMLMFSCELQRRSQQEGWGLSSYAAHPGFARTELIANGPKLGPLLAQINQWIQPFVSHSAAQGALPTLFAAVDPQAQAGAYYGPDGWFELKGPPHLAKVAAPARDADAAARLWTVSEQLTGTHWLPQTSGVARCIS